MFENKEDIWNFDGDAKWSINNGELIGKSDGGFGWITSSGEYENFVLELDFYPSSKVNSGVFIRCKDQAINPDDCYELNIWDAHTDLNNRTGAFVRRARPLKQLNTINKWNTYRIIANGTRVKAWINDTLTVDAINGDLSKGYIGLQAKEKGEIKFKNVRIKEY